MTTIDEILHIFHILRVCGAKIEVKDGRLRVCGSDRPIPGEVLEALRAAEPEIFFTSSTLP
jgi:hypothetical protein